MTILTFEDGLRVPVDSVAGRARWGWTVPVAWALMQARRPRLHVVLFQEAQPLQPLLGGFVVAVDNDSVPGSRVWMPLTGGAGLPRPADEANALDIDRAIRRAHTLALALTHGVGLCLLGGERQAVAFELGARMLIPHLLAGEVPGPAVPWALVYAAAKLYAPDLCFAVQFAPQVDAASGEIRMQPMQDVQGRWWVELVLEAGGQQRRVTQRLRASARTPDGWRPTLADWQRGLQHGLARGAAELVAQCNARP